ncbi:MAG: hypothetical protein HY814_15395 [Candidatus Riflebacteria bacterium]|nr:hypothetical protein [Candidatus Riflebacteria bacterium]
MTPRIRTFCTLILVAALLAGPARAANATLSLAGPDALVTAAFKAIEAHYPQVPGLVAGNVSLGAINGVLAKLDPTGSSYAYAKKDSKARADAPAPGVRVQLVDGVPVLSAVLAHSDAFYKEFAPGDLLVKVGDEVVLGKSLAELETLLSGDAGTSVRLTAYRKAGRRFLDVPVKREVMPLSAAGRAVGRNVSYLQVTQLDKKGVELLKARLEDVNKQKPIGAILDLRSTIGGTPDDALAAAALFVSERPVVQIQGRDGAPQMRSAPAGSPATMPLVIICDGGTAGAAEILAAALQDDKRAVVIGEKTSGLAFDRQTFDLDADHQMTLVTSHYLSPSGRDLWVEGVKPDIAMTPEAVAPDQTVKSRREFTAFCRGEPAAAAKSKETTSVAAAPGTTSTTATTATTPPSSETAEEEKSEEDEEEPAGHDGKPKVKSTDGVLEDYKLVKQHDTVLVRAINIIISASIFYEYGQRRQ